MSKDSMTVDTDNGLFLNKLTLRYLYVFLLLLLSFIRSGKIV